MEDVQMSKLKIGDVFQTNAGGTMKVIEKIRWDKFVVEHQDKYKHRSIAHPFGIMKGEVKNPYQPSLSGKGFLGVGDFVAHINCKKTPEYAAWMCMIQRCYGGKDGKGVERYEDCSVSDEWLNFQNFAEWYVSQDFYNCGYDLDKDLIHKGNRIYCKEYCVLVPPKINGLLHNGKKRRGKYPVGVSYKKMGKKFNVNLKVDGKTKYVGAFDCLDEASNAYVLAKESYVKQIALEWKGKIDKRAFDLLMMWRVVND